MNYISTDFAVNSTSRFSFNYEHGQTNIIIRPIVVITTETDRTTDRHITTQVKALAMPRMMHGHSGSEHCSFDRQQRLDQATRPQDQFPRNFAVADVTVAG